MTEQQNTESKPATRRVRWAGESVIWKLGDSDAQLTRDRAGTIAAGAATYRCTSTEGASTTVPAGTQLYVALCSDALGSRLALGPFTSHGAAADVVAGIPGIRVRGVAALHTGRPS